jgi:hypothetical protein
MNNIRSVLLIIGVFVVCFVAYNSYTDNRTSPPTSDDYRDATYTIDGQSVTLRNGLAETQPTTATKITTTYFGNELKTDLDGDGREDVVFVLTQKTGGSGTFFYAVAALNTEGGYVGSDGYLLGDRIAPQSTDESMKPRHKNVVVFNYLARELSEPMTNQPSVGNSAYLKLVPETMRWAIVEASPGEETAADSIFNLIDVVSPQAGVDVSSPLAVSGKARGYWFFEATAPVVVANWDGLIIAEGYIEAQGDWMTEEFVPFTGEITYEQELDTYSASGTIIFMKANPSGLTENDEAFEMPVQLEDNSN